MERGQHSNRHRVVLNLDLDGVDRVPLSFEATTSGFFGIGGAVLLQEDGILVVVAKALRLLVFAGPRLGSAS